MSGVMIRHRTDRSKMSLVPILSKPFTGDSLKECPGCHIVHPCKVVHLMVNDTGLVMVSTGVLEDLRAAGMPDLEIVSEAKNPPPLHIDGRSTLSFIEQRQKQDYEARRIGGVA